MVPLPRPPHPLHRLPGHRLHPRQEAHGPRSPSLSISQGTFLLPYHPVSSTRKPRLTKTQWLVSRHQLSRVDPRYAYPAPAGYTTYRPPQDDYGMYAMPPPVYDPNAPRPPVYYGPPPTQQQQHDVGATKVDPDQSRGGYQRPTVTEEYEAPAGPPPGPTVRPQGTGNSNPFRD